MNEEEMLDENPQTDEAIENTEVESNEVDARDEVDPLLEKAKELGYKDDDEYTGNPKYKLTPEEYVKRAEKGGTIKKLESDNSELQRQVQETRQAVDKMAKFHELQIQRAKEDAFEEAKRQYEKSIEEDYLTPSEALTKYEANKSKIEQSYAEPKEEPKFQEANEITRFKQENSWYEKDDDLKWEANAEHYKVANKYPGMPLDKQLDMVKRNIIERFPDKFENPKKRQQSIEGGGTVHSGVTRKKDTLQSLGFSHSDILDAQNLIKSGLYKDEAAFIKDYKILNGAK